MADLTPEALAGELEEIAGEWRASARKRDVGHHDRDIELAEARGADYVIAAIRDRLAPAHAALAAERDMLRADLADAHARQNDLWPRCPDGCGCRMDGEDSDARDCGCGGPCTMECRENGYPDAPSYRDLAVKHAMDQADRYRAALEDIRDGHAVYGDYARQAAREALEGGHA